MDKLTERIAGELTVEMIPDGIWKEVAIEIGPINLIKLLALFNGADIYIPKPDRYLIPARKKLVRREFNGYNHEALGKKYGFATAYVKRLCGPGEVAEQCSIFEAQNTDPPE